MKSDNSKKMYELIYKKIKKDNLDSDKSLIKKCLLLPFLFDLNIEIGQFNTDIKWHEFLNWITKNIIPDVDINRIIFIQKNDSRISYAKSIVLMLKDLKYYLKNTKEGVNVSLLKEVLDLTFLLRNEMATIYNEVNDEVKDNYEELHNSKEELSLGIEKIKSKSIDF